MEIKYTYENRVVALMINSVWINLVSLGSMYLSLERLFAKDWPVIIVYIFGSVLGKWVAMTQSQKYIDLINSSLMKNKLITKIFIGINKTPNDNN
jgi:hypothetical protein